MIWLRTQIRRQMSRFQVKRTYRRRFVTLVGSLACASMLASCGQGMNSRDGAATLAPDFQTKLVQEPTETLVPTVPKKAENITYGTTSYKFLDVKFQSLPKSRILTARVRLQTSKGIETIEMAGRIRDDGTATLVDLDPPAPDKHRLTAEALCPNKDDCKDTLVNIHYMIGDQRSHVQFQTPDFSKKVEAAAKRNSGTTHQVQPSRQERDDDELANPKMEEFEGPSAHPAMLEKLTPIERLPAPPTTRAEPSVPAADAAINSQLPPPPPPPQEEPQPQAEPPAAPGSPAVPGTRPQPSTSPAPRQAPAIAPPPPSQAKGAPAGSWQIAPAAPSGQSASGAPITNQPNSSSAPAVPAAQAPAAAAPAQPQTPTAPPKAPAVPAAPAPAAPARAAPAPAPATQVPPKGAAPVAPAPPKAADQKPDQKPDKNSDKNSDKKLEPAPVKPAQNPAPPAAAPAPPTAPKASVPVAAPAEKPKPQTQFVPEVPPKNLSSDALLAREKQLAPLLDLRTGGYAVGTFNGGSIKNASQLPRVDPGTPNNPNNPAYRAGFPASRNTLWGAGIAISMIKLVSAYVKGTFFPNLLVIVGDISLRKGGPFGEDSDHKSHQNGLDVDFAYLGNTDLVSVLSKRGGVGSNFNYSMNWQFFRAIYKQTIEKDGQQKSALNRIFVHPSIKNALCRWADKQTELKNKFDQDILRRIRPTEDSHYKHFHVRLRCSPHYPFCLNQEEPPLGNGC